MKNQVDEEQNPSSIEHGGERQSVAFTPGPWGAGMYKGNPTVFWERGNGTVAIASVHDIASMGDPKANARLIAAAPALYEALKATPCRYSRRRECSSNVIDMCDRCAALELVTPK